MLTIFIRHNWKKFKEKDRELEKIVPELLKSEKKKIGIHCQLNELTKKEALISDNYAKDIKKKEKDSNWKTMEKFIEISKKGAVILAFYSSSKINQKFVGEVKPQPIELLPYKSGNESGKGFWIKTLEMQNARELNKKEMLKVSVIPTRHDTLFEFTSEKHKMKERILTCLCYKSALPKQLDSLAPQEQEVLCYEWLKEKELIKHLLLPIGRTLPDVDIYGINKLGNKVLAQVTYKKGGTDKKIKGLEKYKVEGWKLYFFSNSEKKGNIDGVEYIPLSDVFDHFKESIMIREMLNYSK